MYFYFFQIILNKWIHFSQVSKSASSSVKGLQYIICSIFISLHVLCCVFGIACDVDSASQSQSTSTALLTLFGRFLATLPHETPQSPPTACPALPPTPYNSSQMWFSTRSWFCCYSIHRTGCRLFASIFFAAGHNWKCLLQKWLAFGHLWRSPQVHSAFPRHLTHEALIKNPKPGDRRTRKILKLKAYVQLYVVYSCEMTN